MSRPFPILLFILSLLSVKGYNQSYRQGEFINDTIGKINYCGSYNNCRGVQLVIDTSFVFPVPGCKGYLVLYGAISGTIATSIGTKNNGDTMFLNSSIRNIGIESQCKIAILAVGIVAEEGKSYYCKTNFFPNSSYTLGCCNCPMGSYNCLTWVQRDTIAKSCSILGPDNISENDVKPIRLFPNPVNDILSINCVEPYQLKYLTDIYGRIVMYFPKELEHSERVDLSFLSKGIYFITLFMEDKPVTKKMIKE
jgi:hypothetical protein